MPCQVLSPDTSKKLNAFRCFHLKGPYELFIVMIYRKHKHNHVSGNGMTTSKKRFNLLGHILSPLFGFSVSVAAGFSIDVFSRSSPEEPSFDDVLILAAALLVILVLAYIFQFTALVLIFSFLQRRDKLNGITLFGLGLFFILIFCVFEYFVTGQDNDLNSSSLKSYLLIALFLLSYIVPNFVTYYLTYIRLSRIT